MCIHINHVKNESFVVFGQSALIDQLLVMYNMVQLDSYFWKLRLDGVHIG